MSGSYTRVIPRDLFNEANLLKCLGRFWIKTEHYQPNMVTIEHDGEPFDVGQNDDDGTISVRNVAISINGTRCHVCRPLNSRAEWPLYFDTEEDRIAIFTDAGELTAEVLAMIQAGKAVTA